MNKLLAILVACFISHAVFANHVKIDVTPQSLSNFDNQTDWTLARSIDQYTVQNLSARGLRLDIFVDQYIRGTNIPSDTVYMLCANTLIKIPAGNGVICDLPYPGTASFSATPFYNGATGHISIF